LCLTTNRWERSRPYSIATPQPIEIATPIERCCAAPYGPRAHYATLQLRSTPRCPEWEVHRIRITHGGDRNGCISGARAASICCTLLRCWERRRPDPGL
jgi:hypothetical protein